MKKYASIFLFGLMFFLINSCKKDEGVEMNTALAGEWTIASYNDNGIDKTTQFGPYDLTFDNNGNLSVNGAGMMNKCKWTLNDSIYHFNMMGMHVEPLSELDGDWMLMNTNDSTCNFADNDPSRNCSFMLRRK